VTTRLVQGHAVEAVDTSTSILAGAKNGARRVKLEDAGIARSLRGNTVDGATAHAHREYVAVRVDGKIAKVVSAGGSKHLGPKRSVGGGIAIRILANEEVETSNSVSTNSSITVTSDVKQTACFLYLSADN